MLEGFIEHLRQEGYHPRSNKHSNALAEVIVQDLVAHCPGIAERASRGQLVYDLNFKIVAGTVDWNIDLVMGMPEPGTAPAPPGVAIRRQRPSTVEIAIEIKAVMTEHRKAVKNRKRDLEAHHEHVHSHSDRAIAGGVLVLNAAKAFKSPLRSGITEHRNPKALVEHCLNELRAIRVRRNPQDTGLDAKCGIVVTCDNMDHARSALVLTNPAPPVGDPIHYHAFIQAVCGLCRSRF